jgi:opacity protein-like surface antigen
MNIFKMVLLTAVVALPMMGSAHAADAEPPTDGYAASDAGSFYVRGDLGWSFLDWTGDTENTYVLGGGVGYQYNDNFRADLTVDWANNYKVAPGAEIDMTTVLGNMYFDWANDSVVTPYIGAGLGYGWVNGDGGVADESGVAFGLAAGVAIDLTENVALDVGYKYRDILIDNTDPSEHMGTVGLRFSF